MEFSGSLALAMHFFTGINHAAIVCSLLHVAPNNERWHLRTLSTPFHSASFSGGQLDGRHEVLDGSGQVPFRLHATLVAHNVHVLGPQVHGLDLQELPGTRLLGLEHNEGVLRALEDVHGRQVQHRIGPFLSDRHWENVPGRAGPAAAGQLGLAQVVGLAGGEAQPGTAGRHVQLQLDHHVVGGGLARRPARVLPHWCDATGQRGAGAVADGPICEPVSDANARG